RGLPVPPHGRVPLGACRCRCRRARAGPDRPWPRGDGRGHGGEGRAAARDPLRVRRLRPHAEGDRGSPHHAAVRRIGVHPADARRAARESGERGPQDDRSARAGRRRPEGVPQPGVIESRRRAVPAADGTIDEEVSMPPRKLVLAFVALWFTLGVVLFVLSVRTVLEGLGHHGGGLSGAHLVLIGGIEALAALLLLLPRTLRLGAFGLLFTFAVAIIAHSAAGEFPMQLLLFAAATVFVLVHGPVPLRWVLGRH